jgi:uncharacterized protein YbaR (Trm112 family)
MAVSADLLEILRCPYCVSGPTRKPGNDPGRLELVHESWLVCQEPDCGRKYPIKEDIPVMLIDEGDKWIDTPIDALPEPGQLVDSSLLMQEIAPLAGGQGLNKRLLGLTLGLLALTLVIAFLIWLQRRNAA